VDLRDMYKEDRAAGKDTLYTRSTVIRMLAELFPDIQRVSGAAY